MENPEEKKSYLRERAEQMRKWDKIIDKLIVRSGKAKNKDNTELRHHIVKLQVKKARTDFKLRQLQEAGKEKWDDLKTGLEKNWVELRKAFSKASTKHE